MRSRLLPSFGLLSILLSTHCGATGGTTSSGGTGGAGSTGNGGAGGVLSGTGGSNTTATTGAGGMGTTTTTTTATTGAGGMGTTTTSGAGGSGGCAVGSGDCNNDPADGCETNLDGDVNNCGACGQVCPGAGNVNATCSAGLCGLACPAGTANCDMNAANGCESNTKNDPLNCGSCGTTCMGAPCVQGACACAAESKTANPVPLDLFIMLDRSGSMTAAVAGGGTRWSTVTTALKGFIADPTNAGLGVGIQYFGLPQGPNCPLFCASDAACGANGPCTFGVCFGCLLGASGDSCSIADYATPAVEIAPLAAAQVAALTASINSKTPDTDTPSAPALTGAIQHAKAWEMAHPSHTTVVVFATDGVPTECSPTDIPSIANIASAGLNGSPSVKSFIIGVGDAVGDLNTLAAAGGTGQAFLVDTNANVVQQFQAALNAIQQSALGCEYTIPQPQMGMLDYNKVNVQYTPGGAQPPQLISNVANAAACDPNSGGWYYDNPNAPTKIILCGATCAKVQADPAGKIDILLGCATLHM